MTSLLIKNGLILTMDEKRSIIKDGSVAVEDDRIVSVGKTEKLEKEFKGEHEIDAGGRIIMPGLIDTHTHLFQMLGKGLGDDKNLLTWLTTAWATLGKNMTKEDYRDAVRLGCLEAIKSGTTCLLAFEHIIDAVPECVDVIAEAIGESRVRGIIGRGMRNSGDDFVDISFTTRSKDHILRETRRAIQRWNGAFNGKLNVWPAPSTTFGCSDDLLIEVKDLANQFDVGVTVHVDEAKEGKAYCMENYGTECEVEHLENIGFLNERTLTVHNIWTTEKSMLALKKRSSKVSHNPVSNMYLANGIAPIPRMLELGITVGLGVDGATSNNNQDMIEAMKTTALLQKVSSLNPEIISNEQVIEMATINGAKALLKESDLGSIEPGKKADIIILDLKKPNTTPTIYAPSTIVYCANGSNVSTTIIDGKIVMEDRKVKTLKEEEVILNSQRSIEKLLERSEYEMNRTWKIV